MARTSLVPNAAPKPLEVSRGNLDRRWIELNKSIPALMGVAGRHIQIEADYQPGGVWTGLVGGACERVERQRGLPSFLAPLVRLPRKLVAWLGVQEVWDEGGAKTFIFRQLSLTVHFGFVGDPIKPQVIRSEWAGFRNWSGTGPSFQSIGSGHPHWQFDLSAALRDESDSIAEGLSEVDEHAEQFRPEAVEQDVLALVRGATLERMHFASAAPWWDQTARAYPAHMNAPTNEASLTRWLFGSIEYIRQELSRCQIVNVR